jgi:hypothetical protein
MIKLSKNLPKYPAIKPRIVPIKTETEFAITPINKDVLAPYTILENKSLPNKSVPNKNSWPGAIGAPCSVKPSNNWSSGEYCTIRGAKMDAKINKRMKTIAKISNPLEKIFFKKLLRFLIN